MKGNIVERAIAFASNVGHKKVTHEINKLVSHSYKAGYYQCLRDVCDAYNLDYLKAVKKLELTKGEQ